MTLDAVSPPCREMRAGSPGATGRRIILHIDMDSFYASVEMQRRPELQKQPVVIGADPKGGAGRGVVCTCSYEARAFGVHSAQPISRAFLLCPHAVYLRPDYALYASVSESVMAILRSFQFPFQQVSIDEAVLDLSSLGEYSRVRDAATEMMSLIRSRTGLSCSVGIGPGKTVAKIASDIKKPGGLTIIGPDQLASFLDPLPVRKIPGIGRKSEKDLSVAGILTIGDLARAGPGKLAPRFGRGILPILDAIAGIEDGEVCERAGIRSISRDTTFETDTEDLDLIGDTLHRLTGDACQALAVESLSSRTVTVRIRLHDYTTLTKSRTLPHPVRESGIIGAAVRGLFCDLYPGGKIRLLGVRLSSLAKPDASQTTLGF